MQQPWGCLFASSLLLFSLSLPWFIVWVFDIPGFSTWNKVGLSVLLGLPLFGVMLDQGQRIEIRSFCKSHGLRVIRIKTYRNHFGVDYSEGEVKKYGKWPKDFAQYMPGPHDE